MTLHLIEAARILNFDPAQGWPKTITPDRLASLQAWRDGLDMKTRRSKAATWCKLIELALAAGAIEHTTTTETVQVSSEKDVFPTSSTRSWPDQYTRGGRFYAYTQPAQYRDVTLHHITAHDFAAWLARQGEEPSPHIAAWFKAVGVAPATAAKPPAPAQTAAPTSASDAPVTTASTSEPPAWRVTAPARYRGYTLPLFNVLSAAHRAGEPRPTARDVLEVWHANQPQEIAQVLADGFNYYDSTGNTKAAGLESLRKAIERMTNAR